MALNDVKITKIRNGLDRPAPVEDSIFGMVAAGVSVNGLFDYHTPYLIYGIQDAENIGITETYDSDNHILLWYHINQFFKFAPGQPLWVYLVTQSTPQTAMCDKAEDFGIFDLITQCKHKSQGEIKVVFTVLNPESGYTPTITTNIDADVLAAIPKAQELANALFDAHGPIDIILEGRNFGTSAANALDLSDPVNAYDAENASVVIAQDIDVCKRNTLHQGYADVGTYAGMLSGKYYSVAAPNISLANSPAEVGLSYEGNIQDAANSSFLNYGMGFQELSGWTLDEQGALYDKHYVALRTFAGTRGVYFSQSFTAAAATSDFIFDELSRVYNKAARGIYAAYVPYINTKVRLKNDGTLPGEVVKALEDVGNQVFVLMASRGEISVGKTIIDPTQQILTSRSLIVKWKIIPQGKLENIDGELSFTVTL